MSTLFVNSNVLTLKLLPMNSRNCPHIRIYSKHCNMNDTNKLVSIIKEEISIMEADINPHANFRIDGRLKEDLE